MPAGRRPELRGRRFCFTLQSYDTIGHIVTTIAPLGARLWHEWRQCADFQKETDAGLWQ